MKLATNKIVTYFPIPRLKQQQLRAVPGQILRPAEAAWPTLKRGRQRLVIVCVIVSPKIEIFHVHQEMQVFSDICLEFFTFFPITLNEETKRREEVNVCF